MTWTSQYQSKRDEYWPEVEHFFSRLPPQLFKQGTLLKNNLATFLADTGQFRDILSRENDLPLFYFHFWLLNDLDFPESAHRADLEKHLFVSMAFTFAAVYIQESILDEDTNFDNSYLFLERVLTQQADFHLAQLFPGQSPFWSYHQTFWQEYTETILSDPLIDQTPFTIHHSPFIIHHSKLAFTKIPVAAVAISANRADILPQLDKMMDHLNLIFQIMREVANLRQDLMRRHYTYPILRTMQAAGIDPQQSVSSEQILGAMVLTGSIEKIGRECLTHLAACREISESLNLPTFTAYWPVVENWLNEVMALFSLKVKTKPKPKRPFFTPAIDTLPKMIEMAEGYLLSDLTFRESWEVQRRGIFGRSEITGKAFPAGLIIELLARHGHDMSESVGKVFDTLQATGFRYYDDDHLPPDSDDLGLALRLYPYSALPDIHRGMLQTPLNWLEACIQEAGEIPVWLVPDKTQVEAETRRFVWLWGKSCAAVEANVLLGLIEYDWNGYHTLIEQAAKNLLERLMASGLGATLHYVPLYSLWIAFELIDRLLAQPISNTLQDKLDQTARTLAEQFIVETKRYRTTPQDAAFLSLICHSRRLSGLEDSAFKSEWITILAKTQRYDGSWAGEPLFGTPTRGEVATWYTSRSVTTAFCYHALKAYTNINF